jgi:hypothetical protein
MEEDNQPIDDEDLFEELYTTELGRSFVMTPFSVSNGYYGVDSLDDNFTDNLHRDISELRNTINLMRYELAELKKVLKVSSLADSSPEHRKLNITS